MNLLNRFYLCLGGNELFPEFSLEIGLGAVCDWGGSQGSGQAVAGPISGRSSHLEVRESGGDFLSLIGIYCVIEGVISLKGIPEGFGLC